MKAILMSIRPRHVANILNGIKTLEIRKRFPKDYVGWVYIYCTKDKKYANLINRGGFLTGMVVARFWCDKVETFRCNITGNLKDGFFKAKPYCKVIEDGIANYNCDDEFEDILKNAQLTNKELAQYLGDKECPYGGWYVFNAIHITKLEIFDKPKEISEFKHLVKYKNCSTCPYNHENMDGDICSKCKELKPLARVPQSWCYIEI